MAPVAQSKQEKPPPPPVPSTGVVRFDDILARLQSRERSYDEEFLQRVHVFSARMHKDQTRRSGEPYLTHPLSVAYILADLKFDEVCVAVGLLHDVLEDTLTTRETVEGEFGPEIAELVDGVTKLARHEYVRSDDAQAETFRKMILASAKDIRVILVKLADRLHNMQTLEHLPPEARRRISRETVEIYAPIAHRLGMARVKGDLEDLAFYYLHPNQYAELHSKIEEKLEFGKEATEKIRNRLAAALEEAGIEAEISFRVKRYYSIYQKLRRQGIDISQLYDYLAFRIVTRDLRDTYGALGVVHQNWRPIPGRFKDYLAMPKPNLYQSLHTTVVGERGQPFEIQIRTREMDLVAEEGIAAHWHYKEGSDDPRESDPNILWLRQLLEWQKEVQDPRTFLTSLKIDLYPEEVYVFTPKGDVLSFPRGVTPLDFAYKIHTELGHQCAGARVNGKLVPLRTELHNGDIVEIITNPNRQPSRDWLNVVVTTRAKSKIRHWLNTQQKRRAVEIGRRLLEKEAKKYRIGLKRVFEGKALEQYLQEEGLPSLEEMLSRIGFGKLQPRPVVRRLAGEELEEPTEQPSRLRQAVTRLLPGRGEGPILVKGHGDLLAFMAKCCSPLPGEQIVGYITRGRGVSVHSVDCPNVKNLLYNPEREIEVRWAKEVGEVFAATISIETEDQKGMLAKLTQVVAEYKSNINSIGARTTETGLGLIEMKLEVRDRKHLSKILQALRGTQGVLQVTRRMSASSPGHEGSETG
ncbi:MAG TPA: bifunctional (p)ppGpp synthetase/guanosine-3',5'-bis(diphosphate) 3'-pyrophosphohydrolase [Thermoanaerobaculia bacterium]|nr:bifunctional (p)ppGpp synthetase/guanosine-3',5'-bis(diphosphate) 3'-pyrophosphohydrolase [Thermoanaerobaculia bacterium]